MYGYCINFKYSLFKVPHVLVLLWHWHTNQQGLFKKRHKISVWTEENRHNTSKSVGMSADLAAKLWSSRRLHNHKVCSNYSCHALKKTPSSILLLDRLHVLVRTMPAPECPREHRWQAITTELGRTKLSSTMLLYLCDDKFSISPYVLKPSYVSDIYMISQKHFNISSWH